MGARWQAVSGVPAHRVDDQESPIGRRPRGDGDVGVGHAVIGARRRWSTVVGLVDVDDEGALVADEQDTLVVGIEGERHLSRRRGGRAWPRHAVSVAAAMLGATPDSPVMAATYGAIVGFAEQRPHQYLVFDPA